MNAMRGNLGWIEVVCGPMFSGKSEELIRRLRRAEIAGRSNNLERTAYREIFWVRAVPRAMPAGWKKNPCSG